MMSSLTQTLLELETRLMDPEVRRNGQAADMIADDFVEFGGNGRKYNKSDARAMMRHHAPRIFALEEFNVSRNRAPDCLSDLSGSKPIYRRRPRPSLSTQFNLGAARRQMASDFSSGHHAELT